MAFVEDFDVYFDNEDFAINAIFTPRAGTGGGSKDIKGIFDKEFIAVGNVGEVDISATDPVFMCKTSDAINARGGTLSINGKTYNIAIDKPDGTGMSMLVLEDDS